MKNPGFKCNKWRCESPRWPVCPGFPGLAGTGKQPYPTPQGVGQPQQVASLLASLMAGGVAGVVGEATEVGEDGCAGLTQAMESA